MCIYLLSYIIINGKVRHFNHKISKVIKYKDTYIVLLEIPFDCDEINNIYCLDKKANIKWQSEDLSKKYPKHQKLPYEYMYIEGNKIYATDFMCIQHEIEAESGKILGCKLMK